MATEIERKYLVDGNPWELHKDVKTTKITQGYFTNSSKHTIRVRTKVDMVLGNELWFSGKQTSCITIKGPRVDITCDEFEYPISNEDAFQLLAMCDLGVVEKIRHTFKDEHNQRWEIDEFTDHNKGIPHLAEIELITADTPVILPSWVILDVSNDECFVNSHLAMNKLYFRRADHSHVEYLSKPLTNSSGESTLFVC
jgi:CYTH domain-containing protein